MGWRLLSTIHSYGLLTRKAFDTNKILLRSAVKLSFKRFANEESSTNKTAIILIHGLLGNKKLWGSIGKTLLTMTKRPIYAVDLRNHGASPHTCSSTYIEMANDVLYLMQWKNIKKAFVVGHDVGGRTGMVLALSQPEKVQGLAVIDISPITNCEEFTVEFPRMLKAIADVNLSKLQRVKSKSNARIVIGKQLALAITNEIYLHRILTNVGRRYGRFCWKCNLTAIIDNFHQFLELTHTMVTKYNGPAIFIGGQLSDFIPPDDLPKIRAKFPQSVLTYIPKVGHNIHIEDTKSFLELVISFVKRNDDV